MRGGKLSILLTLLIRWSSLINIHLLLKQVYLHVITYNTSAIRFYRKNNYTELRCISEFYHFNDKYHDSYLYVRYLNNYKAPMQNRVWSTARYLTVLCAVFSKLPFFSLLLLQCDARSVCLPNILPNGRLISFCKSVHLAAIFWTRASDM